MQKVWAYITAFLGGVIAGLILMYKLMGEQIKVTVKKIKNKKTAGDNSVTIPIDIDSDSLSRREERRLKRQKRKENKK